MRFLLATLIALTPPVSAAAGDGLPKQLVIVSFDGAHDNDLWLKSREMAARTGAHFTYFLSCTFLMARGTPVADAYQAPRHKSGRSATGFAQTNDEVITRLGQIWQARQEGHEIASHACGHFDGGQWTKAEWLREFSTFTATLTNAFETSGHAKEEPEGWRDFVRNDIRGFRAPYLSAGPALPEAEAEAGFAYDASLVTKGPALPDRHDGFVRFGLPLVPEGPSQKPVIAMDYNLYARHSRAKEDVSRSAEFEDRALAAYRAAFERQYAGERVPLQLGFHFVEMNGGAYWRALDRFLTETCRKPDVACVTYGEALDILKKAEPLEKAEGGGPEPRRL